jgi:hypothetical protein
MRGQDAAGCVVSLEALVPQVDAAGTAKRERTAVDYRRLEVATRVEPDREQTSLWFRPGGNAKQLLHAGRSVGVPLGNLAARIFDTVRHRPDRLGWPHCAERIAIAVTGVAEAPGCIATAKLDAQAVKVGRNIGNFVRELETSLSDDCVVSDVPASQVGRDSAPSARR